MSLFKRNIGNDENKLLVLLKALKGIKKQIVILYYGYNESKCLSQKEIAEKLGMEESYIAFVLDDIENKIEEMEFDAEPKPYKTPYKKKTDKPFQTEKISKELQQLIIRMSEMFFNMFPEHNPLQIENAASHLSKKEKQVVFLYYGLDGVHCLDYDEIASKLGISVDQVDKMLEDSISKIKKILKNSSYVKEKYTQNRYNQLISVFGKEKVEEAMQKLDEIRRKVIIEYYTNLDEITYREIGEKYGISTGSVSSFINIGLKKVENILNNRPEKSSNKTIKFYRLFENYTKEEIDNVIARLCISDQDIITLFYGLKGEKVSLQQLADKYGVNTSALYNYINRIKNNISEMLNNPDIVLNATKGMKIKSSKKENKYLTLLNKYGARKVNEALSKLKEKEQEIFKLYYGIYCKKLSADEIASKYGLMKSSIYVTVNNTINKIIKILEKPQDFKSNKEKFFDLFSGYSDQQIEDAFNKLTDTTKTILDFRYGLTGECLAAKKIAQKLNVSQAYIFTASNKGIKKIKEILENPEKAIKTKANTRNIFTKLVSEHGKDKVDEALKKLSEKDRDIFSLYYGVSDIQLNQVDIAKRYNTSNSNISATIKRIIKKIEKLINNPNVEPNKTSLKNNGKNKYIELIEKYGEEKVLEALARLSEIEQDSFKLYCGINGESLTQIEIAKKYNVKPAAISARITKALKKIIDIIENPQPTLLNKKKTRKNFDNKYLTLINKYGEEVVINALNKTNEREKNIFKLYYGVDCERISTKEIALKYNLSIGTVYSHIDLTYKKIIKLIENPQEVKTNKDKFYALFEGYSVEEINSAIIRLPDTQREIIDFYYGLNNNLMPVKEIKEKFNISNSAVFYNLNKGIINLKKLLIDPKLIISKNHSKKGKIKKNLYMDLINEYGQEKIELSFAKLSQKEQNILRLYYGLDGEEKISQDQIAVIYGMAIGSISNLIKRAVIKIKNDINDIELTPKKRKNNEYINLVNKYGEDKVKEAISKLDEKNKAILNLYFGIEGIYLSQGEIAKKYGITAGAISIRVRKSLKSIEEIIENPNIVKEKRNISEQTKDIITIEEIEVDTRFSNDEQLSENSNPREERFYNLIKGYDNNIIKKSIKKLSESERAFLAMYYTLGNTEYYTLSDIARRVNVYEKDLSVLEEKILNKLDKIIKKNYIQEMRSIFTRLIVDKSKLKNISEIITVGELNLLGFYFGLNGEDIVNITQLSEKLNLSKEDINRSIKNIINKINNYKPTEKR